MQSYYVRVGTSAPAPPSGNFADPRGASLWCERWCGGTATSDVLAAVRARVPGHGKAAVFAAISTTERVDLRRTRPGAIGDIDSTMSSP